MPVMLWGSVSGAAPFLFFFIFWVCSFTAAILREAYVYLFVYNGFDETHPLKRNDEKDARFGR